MPRQNRRPEYRGGYQSLSGRAQAKEVVAIGEVVRENALKRRAELSKGVIGRLRVGEILTPWNWKADKKSL
jgi:hypothetical protein